MDTSSITAARVVNGTKIYGEGETEVRALDEINVEFQAGEFTAIMGPSGSGKSTLMHCVAGLDTLTTGQSFINEVSLVTYLIENSLCLDATRLDLYSRPSI